MWTAGIVVFLASFWATADVVRSSIIVLGYYVVVGVLSFVLRKCGLKFVPRLMVQLIIALVFVGLAYLGNTCGFNGAVCEGSAAASKGKEEGVQGKEEKVRDFVLKESPGLWKTYQFVISSIEEKDKRIVELRKTLELFSNDVANDADLRRLIQSRDELIRSRDVIKAKMDEAYVQSRKFAAAPERKEFVELSKKAVHDGQIEARKVLLRIKEMRSQK